MLHETVLPVTLSNQCFSSNALWLQPYASSEYMDEHILQTAFKGISVVVRLKKFSTKIPGGILNQFLAFKYTEYFIYKYLYLSIHLNIYNKQS